MDTTQLSAKILDLNMSSVDCLETENRAISDVIVSQVKQLNISEENKESFKITMETNFNAHAPLINESGSKIEAKSKKTTNVDPQIIFDTEQNNDIQELNTDKGLLNYDLVTEVTKMVRHAAFNPNDPSSDNGIRIIVCDKEVYTPNMSVVAPKSAVIINKKSESLRNLLVYDSDDSKTPGSLSDESEDEDANNKNKAIWQSRLPITVETDSESDSTVEDGGSDEGTDDFNEGGIDTDSDSDNSVKIVDIPVTKKKAPLSKHEYKEKEEDRLPPVPDLSHLSINFENEEFLHMGHIDAIVDKLVTIEALPGLPAYDLDSYLFIEQSKSDKKPLGAIFDVMGPVTAPLYCVRFNTVKDVQDLELKKGIKVFVAPRSEYSKYVFVSELLKIKGTDASWKDDQERPDELDDFSDDEKEHEATRGFRRPQLKRRHGSLERHQDYERTMNQCNVLNTGVNRLLDNPNTCSRGRIRASRSIYHQPENTFQGLPCNNSWNAASVPAFDPSVPPPGFGALIPPGVQQSNRPNNPYVALPIVPAHMREPNVPRFHSLNNMWASAPWLQCDQSIRYLHGTSQRPNHGRGFNLLNRPNHGSNPPGPSSNNNF